METVKDVMLVAGLIILVLAILTVPGILVAVLT